MVATDNRPPDQLPEALDDRFGIYVRLDEPHPDAIARLHPQLRELALSSAKLEDGRRVSARGWQFLESLIPSFGLEASCLLAFGPDRGPLVFEAIAMALRGKAKKNTKKAKRK